MDSIFVAGKNITLNGTSYRIGEEVDVSEVSRKRINLLLRTGRLHTSHVSAQEPEKKNSGQSLGNVDSDKQSTNETTLPGSGLTKGIKPRG